MKQNQLNQRNKVSFTARELAELAGGILKADPDLEITGYRGAGSVSSNQLTYAESAEYLEAALNNGAGLILLTDKLYQARDKTRDQARVPAIIVESPKLAYARLVAYFSDDRYYKPGIADSAILGSNLKTGKDISIHPGVIIGENVRVGDRARIASGVIIGDNCEIGNDALLHPGVKIMTRTKIGDRVEIQAGAVIGADGYGYVSDDNGKHYKMPQLGRVIIEDDVEIGALTAIDRAANEETVIGQGTKIDNLVQIGHNVEVGINNLIVSQTGIGGSTKLGARVTLAGQAGIEDHIKITDGVTVTGKGKVSKDIKEPGFYSGIPAREHREYLKEAAGIRRINKLKKEISDLKGELEEIKNYLREED